MPIKTETKQNPKLRKVESMMDSLKYEDSTWMQLDPKIKNDGKDCVNIYPKNARNAWISVHINDNREWIDLTVKPSTSSYDKVIDRFTKWVPVIQSETKRTAGIGKNDNFMKCLHIEMLKKDDPEKYCQVVENLFKYVMTFRA